MKKLAFALACLIALTASAETRVEALGRTTFFVEWKMSSGNDEEWAKPGFHDSAWTAVRNMSEVRIADPDGWFWLRMRFSVPKHLADKNILVTLGRVPFPSKVYLNGVKIQERGDFPPEYNVQIGTPMAIALPPELLSRNDQNVLAIQGNYFGKSFTMTDTAIVDAEAYRFEGWLSELLNARLYYIFSGILLFATVFFGFMFALKPAQREYLYVGLSCLFMALYYYEIGAPRMIVQTWYIRVVMKACLNVSLVFMVHFFVKYLGIAVRRATIPSLYLIVAVSSFLILSSTDETSLNANFKVNLAFTLFFALSGLIRVLACAMTGNRDAAVILVGGIVGIGTGLYDSLSILTGIEPFALLEGIGLFVLHVSIFVSVAFRLKREQPREEIFE